MDEKKRKIKEQEKKVEERLKKIKHKLMVISGKGGVGKTTVVANLAFSLRTKGYSVGLMDADIHGPNLPKMLGIENEKPIASSTGELAPVLVNGVRVMSIGFLLPSKNSAVIWRGPMKMGAIRQFLSDVNWGNLDYLIADLPPGTGDEPLSVAQLMKDVNGTIIVTTPQEMALLDSRKAVNFARQIKTPVTGIIENMSGFVCPHCGKQINIFRYGGGERSAAEMDVSFLGRAPFDVRVMEASDNGVLAVSQKESKTAEAFERIAEKVTSIVEKG